MMRIRSRINAKTLVIFSGYFFSIGMFLVLYATFLHAYFHGGKTTVAINIYGESLLEFIVIPIVFVFSSIGLILYAKDFLKRQETKTSNVDG